MNFFTILLVALVALAAAVLFRRFQARNARLVRAELLASRILSGAEDGTNRQDLADVLHAWDDLKPTQQTELVGHLSNHPRLDGVDVTDAAQRRRAYEGLVGISPGKSPEK